MITWHSLKRKREITRDFKEDVTKRLTGFSFLYLSATCPCKSTNTFSRVAMSSHIAHYIVLKQLFGFRVVSTLFCGFKAVVVVAR